MFIEKPYLKNTFHPSPGPVFTLAPGVRANVLRSNGLKSGHSEITFNSDLLGLFALINKY